MLLDNPTDIQLYRLCVLKGAIKLEAIGMKRRGKSALKCFKDEYGFKGNARQAVEEIERILKN